MLEIKNWELFGLDGALRRCRFPSQFGEPSFNWESKEADYKRGKKLGKMPVGSGHPNFLKGIIVQFDLKYSLYITKQLQRYHWFEIISSQSTMHSLTKRGDIKNSCNKYVWKGVIDMMNVAITAYNGMKGSHKSNPVKYNLFMEIVSNTPAGFEQWMGITTNYLQLKTLYRQRLNHKLAEDYDYLCNWISTLPYFKELVLGE